MVGPVQSFLSKKSFHPNTHRNIARVQQAEESQRQKERHDSNAKAQRALDDERQRLAGSALQRPHTESNRVDFLYEGPAADAAAAAAAEARDHLLGKPVPPKKLDEPSDLAKLRSLPGAAFLAPTRGRANATNEEFNRMSADPLVEMRRQEQAALKRILDNPLRVAELREAAAQPRQEPQQSTPKRHKRHKSRKGSRHDGERDGDAEHERRRRRESKRASEREGKREGKRERRERRKRHKEGGRERRRHDSSTSSSRAGSEERQPPLPQRAAAGAEREATTSSSAQQPQQPLPPTLREGYGLQLYRRGEKLPPTASCAAAAASARADGTAPPAAAHATCPPPPKRAQPAPPPPPPPRRPMDDAERARRAAEMMRAAEVHSAVRAESASAAGARELAEAAVAPGGDGSVPSFLSDVARSTFASTDDESLASRISQRAHYVQRGVRNNAETFMKRG